MTAEDPEPDAAFRCSRASRERGEWLHATASRVAAWLFVEQPGPWGYGAVQESRLPRAVAVELHQRCGALGIRVVLIRRPDRTTAQARRAVAAAWTTPRSVWLAEGEVGEPAALLDIDLQTLAAGRTPDPMRPSNDPLFPVCTNGRRDVCCAERGRPLVRSMLAHADPAVADRTWECSHIGGDRFAANLLCFPHGVYYGWMAPHEGVPLAMAYREGRLGLRHYRGRAGLPVAVQAAEQFLRERDGIKGVDDLIPQAWGRQPDGSIRVRFDRPGHEPLTQVVRVTHEGSPHRLTCKSEHLSVPPGFSEVRSG